MSITWLYLLSVVIAGVALGLLLTIPIGRNYNSGFILLFATIVMVNMAYYAVACSTTLEEATMASNFTCFDATFLTLFLALSMVSVCRIKINNLLVSFAFAFSSFVQFLAFTSGHTDWFTREIIMERVNGYTRIHRMPGTLYPIVIAMLVIYVCVSVGLIIYAFHNRKTISYKNTFLLGIALSITIMGFFVETIFNSPIELLPFFFNVMEFVILYAYQQMDKYDVDKAVMFNNDQLQDRAYIIFDKQKNFIGANQMAKDLFPELAELQIDRYPNQAFIEEEFLVMIENFIGGQSPSKTYHRGDIDLRCRVIPFLNASGSGSKGYIIEGTNETESLRHLSELNHLNRELSKAVSQANKANSAKSDFLSNMSHEIRTPINAVLGMNEMILRESKDKDILGYAKDIQSSGQMLLALINDILDFSKIESGKMELICDNYHLSSIVHDTTNMIRPRIDDKCLTFQREVADNLPEVLYGDETRIRQIIINLLTNAVKYTDTGVITLSFDSIRDTSQIPELAAKSFRALKPEGFIGDQIILRIAVTDTGRGISEENLVKLFDSFSRVDEAKNRGIEGTGLGLSITKRFTDMMGGQILVHSEYGKGSTFTVYLPMAVMSDKIMSLTPATAAPAAASENALPTLNYPDARLLVVDDVKVNLRLVLQFLKNSNLTIDTAENGPAAINLCKANKYDMIFMDHMMPGMDGIETFHHIQDDEDSLNKDVPTVMLTANAISGVSEEYLSEGFCDYLSKPFTPKQLENMIRKHLEDIA